MFPPLTSAPLREEDEVTRLFILHRRGALAQTGRLTARPPQEPSTLGHSVFSLPDVSIHRLRLTHRAASLRFQRQVQAGPGCSSTSAWKALCKRAPLRGLYPICTRQRIHCAKCQRVITMRHLLTSIRMATLKNPGNHACG